MTKEKQTGLKHELKSLINGSIKDIRRFDDILNELGKLSFNDGYEVCRGNVYAVLK